MPQARLLVLAGLLAMGLSLSSSASPLPADSTTLAVDSAHVAVRAPSDTLLAQFRNDPAFNYEQGRRWTWWQDVKRWMRAQLARLFGHSTVGGEAFRFALYLVLALLVGYAAYMLVRLRSDARAPGRTDPETVAHPQTAEEMQAIDFEARVEAAVTDEQYRRAVRLLYQQALQRLDRAGAIAWRPSKTNRTYVHEVATDLRPAFSTLTRLFEQVWYGGATVDAERFAQIRAQFDSFWDTANGKPDDDPSADASLRRDASPTAPSSA